MQHPNKGVTPLFFRIRRGGDSELRSGFEYGESGPQPVSLESNRETNHCCRGWGGANGSPFFSSERRSSTSPEFGKRPKSFLEKSRVSPDNTSNWPRLPSVMVTVSPKRDCNDAARPTARSL